MFRINSRPRITHRDGAFSLRHPSPRLSNGDAHARRPNDAPRLVSLAAVAAARSAANCCACWRTANFRWRNCKLTSARLYTEKDGIKPPM
jgi:hypothetical protein